MAWVFVIVQLWSAAVLPVLHAGEAARVVAVTGTDDGPSYHAPGVRAHDESACKVCHALHLPIVHATTVALHLAGAYDTPFRLAREQGVARGLLPQCSLGSRAPPSA